MGRLSSLVDEIYTRLAVLKLASYFSFNDFDVAKSWMPRAEAKTFADDYPSGRVYIVGLASDDTTKSRTAFSDRTVSVQIGYQKVVTDPESYSEVSPLVEFIDDELKDAIRTQVALANYAWFTNESLKDDTDTPFAFIGMREGSWFESFFTARFHHLVQ